MRTISIALLCKIDRNWHFQRNYTFMCNSQFLRVKPLKGLIEHNTKNCRCFDAMNTSLFNQSHIHFGFLGSCPFIYIFEFGSDLVHNLKK